MDHESPSVTGEREPKRSKRAISPHSESFYVPSTPPSTSGAVSLTVPSSLITSTLDQHVGSSQTSNPAEVKMASSTPIEPHNPRGIRSKASLDMLEGDQFTVRVGPEDKWVLPRRLLASHSTYFAGLPSDKKSLCFTKGGMGEAFALFAQWLYLGELDFDGVDVPGRVLVRAWRLGDTYGCPAFKDHAMAQLIKSHRERGIDPLVFRYIFQFAKSGSKLHTWAIDQFHSKITYRYTGYENGMDEDDPNDKARWKKYATSLKHFSHNFLVACLDAGPGINGVKKPWENGQQYMEVLSYAEIVGCKEEGRSTKAED